MDNYTPNLFMTQPAYLPPLVINKAFFVHSDHTMLTTSKIPLRKLKCISRKFNNNSQACLDQVQSSIPYSSMDDHQILSTILSIF